MNILGVGENAIEVAKEITSEFILDKDIFKNISIKSLTIGIYQPRNRAILDQEKLSELVDSIKTNGVLQPILVRESGEKQYEIIAGERRFQAGKIAGLTEIPCIVKRINQLEAHALAIVENVQREQLTQLEESEALAKLKDMYSLSVEGVCHLIGKPRTTIANLIRVSIHASPKIKEMCAQGLVEFGHLRAVLSLEHEKQEQLMNYVAANNLSVRRTEEIVRHGGFFNKINLLDDIKERNITDEFGLSLKKLKQYFSSEVKIKHIANGKIRMFVDFGTIDSFNNYLKLIDFK